MTKTETIETKLKRFHSAFNHPVNERYPQKISMHSGEGEFKLIDKHKTLRRKLIMEEYEEVLDAIENKKPDEILKELCDLVYVCVGFAVTYGWNFDAAFNRVHDSNMSKLDEKGHPVFRKDGKVIKSDCYRPPQLTDLV
tara:strand:+ start:8413 stop:8829 length:417 start_codon:yes stop_codon:yes gene_type:complete